MSFNRSIEQDSDDLRVFFTFMLKLYLKREEAYFREGFANKSDSQVKLVDEKIFITILLCPP